MATWSVDSRERLIESALSKPDVAVDPKTFYPEMLRALYKRYLCLVHIRGNQIVLTRIIIKQYYDEIYHQEFTVDAVTDLL